MSWCQDKEKKRSEVTMQKYANCKTQTTEKNFAREPERNKNVDQTNRRMETEGN